MCEKMRFADTIIQLDNNMPKGLNECERYGMTWGCDKDCPVFERRRM